jgi:hypothetical protein
MSPGEVPKHRRSYAKPLVVLGVGSAIAGLLAFFFHAETRLGYAWSAYPAKFALASAVKFLYTYGQLVVVGVPVMLVIAAGLKVVDGREGRGSIVGACFGALLIWSFLSAAMFLVLFFTHMGTGQVEPDSGMVLPALLIAVGYILIGGGMVVWGFQPSSAEQDRSANHPVNTDARASAAPPESRRARAGYWER